MIEMYGRLFGTRPSGKFQSPLEKGDHSEMDTSNLLDDDGRAVMTLSGFRIAPRAGHLERINGNVSQFKDEAIRFRTNEPDY